MRRRFTICFAALIVVTIGCLCALWFASRPAHRINESTLKQIKEGMTLVEVESILGVPAGDYSTRRVFAVDWVDGRGFNKKKALRTWTSNELFIVVEFDANDCVESARPVAVTDFDQSWWTRFLHWSRLE